MRERRRVNARRDYPEDGSRGTGQVSADSPDININSENASLPIVVMATLVMARHFEF